MVGNNVAVVLVARSYHARVHAWVCEGDAHKLVAIRSGPSIVTVLAARVGERRTSGSADKRRPMRLREVVANRAVREPPRLLLIGRHADVMGAWLGEVRHSAMATSRISAVPPPTSSDY